MNELHCSTQYFEANRLGTYDWSYQVEEEATDFAVIAFISNPSSSSSSNSKVQSCSRQCEQYYKQLKTLFDEEHKKLSKANIEIIGYQYGLESIDGQLRVHQQNEVIYEEKIRFLEYQVKDKSNLLKYIQKQLDEALKEKEDLKAKLEKFKTSSKNLTKLLDSQISAKVKTSLGYDRKFNEKEMLDIKEEEVIETVFDNHSSDKENSVANDRFKKGKGYHAVLHPLTENYMPPKPDLMSHLIKDYTFHEDRMAKKSVLLTNVRKGISHKESRPVWKNVQRINHQNNFAATAVLTRSGRIPVSVSKPKAATSTIIAKPVNTAGPKQSVNFSRTTSTFHKSHSPIRRSKAVSAVKGNRVTIVKTSPGCVWRPRVNAIDQLSKYNRWIYTCVDYGHLQQALKNKGIVDSGCSKHMTGNKAYLADYQEIHDGGFVAFGLSRGTDIEKITRKEPKPEKMDARTERVHKSQEFVIKS
nr:ribonuclease H-like domain-containing protein [Tanacetum cinerariifolium]